MKKNYTAIVLMFLIVAAMIKCEAQDSSRSLLRQVIHENQEAVNAIAMYPRETRKIIFEACEYPEIIAKLNAMQKNSQDAFEKLISSLSKNEQEKIWNLTRYDSLISAIVANRNMSNDEFKNILVDFPEEIRKTALEERKNNYALLVQIDKMNKSYDSDFGKLLNGYPAEAINAFRDMMNMPEVLNILFEHMQYTVVVGDYYKKNPERVLHKTDSLNIVLTQKNTQEADEWKQSMNDNPEAQKEYTQAAQEYAQDNGYQPEDYNVTLTQDVTNYNANPYNWWFGYPSWYPYDYWNPYPYWYDWGFYYGAGRQVVFFGLPSAYFMDWYFYYPEHCSKYPELSNHYYNYYNNHRESRNSNTISHGVNDWRNRNKDVVTDDWDKYNYSDRIQRFKEYGKMETDRKKYNAKNPQQQAAQSEYIQKNQNKYPLLSAEVSKKTSIQNDSKTKSVQGNTPEPVKKPAVSVPNRYKAPANEQINNKQSGQNSQQNNNVENNNVNRQQQPSNATPQPNNNYSKQRPDNANVQQKNYNSVKQTENFNQIRNAQQYHENTWQQMQPQSQPVRQSQQQNNTSTPRQQENRQIQQPARQGNPSPSNGSRR